MLKLYRYSPLIVLAAVVMLTAVSASAQVTNPVIFGRGFATEGARMVDGHFSTAGDSLVIVGLVETFQAPFDDLDALRIGGVEYTYVLDGMVSGGTTASGAVLITYTTPYNGGGFRVYEDTSPDADYANPATFMDGTLILQGTFSAYTTKTFSFTCSGRHDADLQFTGGSLFSRVSSGGVGTTGIHTGLLNLCAQFVDDAMENLGYFATTDSKFDIVPPTPVTPSTWSRIKQQY